MLPRPLEAAVVSRSWDRNVERVVEMFSNFKVTVECGSN